MSPCGSWAAERIRERFDSPHIDPGDDVDQRPSDSGDGGGAGDEDTWRQRTSSRRSCSVSRRMQDILSELDGDRYSL